MEMGKSDLGGLERCLANRSILTLLLPGLLGIFENKIVAVGRTAQGVIDGSESTKPLCK